MLCCSGCTIKRNDCKLSPEGIFLRHIEHPGSLKIISGEIWGRFITKSCLLLLSSGVFGESEI